MGVTLERVQNKFACIIGELSSEPDILSQFTIWVDLRIAEFKTKGTISLDCCGESPNPLWLRGFKPGPRTKGDIESSSTDMGAHFLHRVAADRLQPEVVEETSDVCFTKVCRKRPPSSTAVNTSKVKRMNASASHTAEPVNESLMSIIGSDTETIEQVDTSASFDLIKSLDNPFSPSALSHSSPSKGDHSSATNPATTDPVSNSVVTVTAEKTIHREQAASSPTIIRVYPTFVNKGSDSPESSTSNRAVPTTPSGSSSASRRAGGSGLYPVNFPERLSNNVIKTRVVGYAQKPHNSTVNTVNAVGTLERWLWNRYDENRNIETIPPSELDAYLAEFFQILQKPNGLDYTADSMSNLRCSLERFLKDHMYPCSISKSQEFAKSRQVFTERRRSLASERFQMEKRSIQEEWNTKLQ